MNNLAVMVSGSGTNLLAIINAIENKTINNAVLKLVISDNKNALALDKANDKNIKNVYINKNDSENLEKVLDDENIDKIVLAGYISILPANITKKYEVINIHPSLVPFFAGKGFYGLKVHEAVIKSGMKITGGTVHFVDENIDTGPIIMQETVEVFHDDTAHILQQRVLQVEHKILIKVIQLWCNDKIKVTNGRVIIDKGDEND